ncbi:MAG: hypothetical protein IJI68_00105 [Eggerthellaceae bacterium]|nr:hypothetical protein [Eggerthellaceae bacterium]
MTAKELNDIIEEYVGPDFKAPYPLTSNAKYREAVPVVVKLALAKAKAYDWARKIGQVYEALNNAAGVYALQEPEALDEPLTEIRSGVFNSVVEIDGVDYRFTKSVGDPKRIDEAAITQAFMGGLPSTWTKPRTGVELDKSFLRTLTAAQLRAKGLCLPDKYTWTEDL